MTKKDEVLVLSGSSWSMDGSIEKLTNAANSKASGHTKIHVREFDLNTTLAATMVNLIQKGRYDIKDLSFEECTGHVAIVVTVALTLANLNKLTISLGNLATAAFSPLAHSLGVGLQSRNSSLKTLQLKSGSNVFFTLSADAAHSLEQGFIGNQTLESIHLEGCRFAETGAVQALARGIGRLGTLREAKFISCFAHNGHPLDDDSVAALIRGLEHNTSLERLNLSRNKCLQRGISALAALLDRTKIKHIDLSYQCIDQGETMDLSALVGALGRTATLESLELKFNKLSSDRHMAFLAAALMHNTSIKYIGLASNKIENVGLEILTSRIPSMKVLEKLNISNNSFDDNTAQALAEAMKENFSIGRVECNQNLQSYKSIRYYADLNFGGRKFVKKPLGYGISPVQQSLWPLVLARVAQLQNDQIFSSEERQAEVLYYLLRHGPAMFPL
jgi:hypothetical protein